MRPAREQDQLGLFALRQQRRVALPHQAAIGRIAVGLQLALEVFEELLGPVPAPTGPPLEEHIAPRVAKGPEVALATATRFVVDCQLLFPSAAN